MTRQKNPRVRPDEGLQIYPILRFYPQLHHVLARNSIRPGRLPVPRVPGHYSTFISGRTCPARPEARVGRAVFLPIIVTDSDKPMFRVRGLGNPSLKPGMVT